MRDVGFEEGFADGLKAEAFIERDSVGLGVKTEGLSALAAGFGKERVHETGTKALMADSGEHATDTEDGVIGDEFVFVRIEGRFGFFAEEACVGNDLGSAR